KIFKKLETQNINPPPPLLPSGSSHQKWLLTGCSRPSGHTYVAFLHGNSYYTTGSVGRDSTRGPGPRVCLLGPAGPRVFWTRWVFGECEEVLERDSPRSLNTHIQVWTGTVSGWEEAKINSSNPLRYDRQSGEFTVTRAGLYYLYSQVHFDEGKAVYLKLDLLVDDALALRCLEEFSATAASSPGSQVPPLHVSGLLPLRPGSSLRIRTLPWAHLKAAPFLTYFGLFQVH
uniref:THD domain-containing protein n=1 Tax=Lynx canadensis TaxID=61383 RepID=A0A667HXE3_LYNCA